MIHLRFIAATFDPSFKSNHSSASSWPNQADDETMHIKRIYLAHSRDVNVAFVIAITDAREKHTDNNDDKILTCDGCRCYIIILRLQLYCNYGYSYNESCLRTFPGAWEFFARTL